MRRRRSAAVLALLAALAAGCATTGEVIQPSHTQVRRLDTPLTQTFVARGDNVAQVSVLVATYAVEGPNAVLRMDLSGAGEQRTAFADLSDVGDGTWLALTVAPIAGAAGQTFTATFSAEGTQPVALAVNPHDPYPHGRLTPASGDLAFEVGHAGRLPGLAGALRRIAGTFAARLAADAAFATVWALLLLAALAGLAAALRAERPAMRAERAADQPRDRTSHHRHAERPQAGGERASGRR